MSSASCVFDLWSVFSIFPTNPLYFDFRFALSFGVSATSMWVECESAELRERDYDCYAKLFSLFSPGKHSIWWSASETSASPAQGSQRGMLFFFFLCFIFRNQSNNTKYSGELSIIHFIFFLHFSPFLLGADLSVTRGYESGLWINYNGKRIGCSRYVRTINSYMHISFHFEHVVQ